jgi:hypothetical protein
MRFVKIFRAIALIPVASAVILYVDSSSRSTLKASNPVEEFGTISGRVLDADGRPVEKVIVTAENHAFPARVLPRAETNREGEFTIVGLTPGRYQLYTRKEEDGYPRTEFNLYDVGLPNSEVTVSPGQTAPGIVVRLGPKAALLTGQVIDAVSKEPLRHADITVRRVDLPDRFLRTGLYLPVELGEFKLLVPSVAFTVTVTETGYEDWYYQSDNEGSKTSSLLLEPNTTKHLLIALHRIKRERD